MNDATKHPKYLPASAIMLIACIVSGFAWWWWRSSATTGIDPVDLWLTYLAMELFVAGWLIVSEGSYSQVATKLTDILIPLLSGLIWGLLALLVLNLSRIFGKYVHASHSSR